MLALRKPTVEDVDRMQALMAPHVLSEALLPRTRLDLVRGLRDFVLAEEDGELIGLASVSLVDVHLAEVGAVVCERPERLNELMDAVLDEARTMGVDRAFVLAPDPAPYRALGFEPTELSALPEKRDRQCLRCPRLPRCRQVPLVRSLGVH
jgi:amino-acid N-acetyltransferase